MHTGGTEAVPRDMCETLVGVHRMEYVDTDNDNRSWYHSALAVRGPFAHKGKKPAKGINAASSYRRANAYLFKRTPQARSLIARVISTSQHLPAGWITLMQSPSSPIP